MSSAGSWGSPGRPIIGTWRRTVRCVQTVRGCSPGSRGSSRGERGWSRVPHAEPCGVDACRRGGELGGCRGRRCETRVACARKAPVARADADVDHRPHMIRSATEPGAGRRPTARPNARPVRLAGELDQIRDGCSASTCADPQVQFEARLGGGGIVRPLYLVSAAIVVAIAVPLWTLGRHHDVLPAVRVATPRRPVEVGSGRLP